MAHGYLLHPLRRILRLPRLRFLTPARVPTRPAAREATENKPALTRTDDLSDPAKVASQLNYTLGSLPLVGGNQFTLHTDNHQAMVEMSKAVDRATEYVHFEFYIAAYDESSAVLWDSLFAAHRRGVQVRVLIDHIG